MMYFFPINKKKLVVSCIIAIVALIGDKSSTDKPNHAAAAVCDNLTHGFIGAFTWIGIYAAKTSSPTLAFFWEIFLCGLLSSLIDVDHFIAAKSIHLKDATSLRSRPFMHCTSLTATIVFSVLSLSHLLKSNWLFKLGWILAAAFFSHHIRDSNRRGFWLWPFGSTPPTPTFLYLLSQMLLPYVLSFAISSFSSQSLKSESLPNVETV